MSEFYGDLTVAGATDCMTRFELRDGSNDPITDAVAADLAITYQIDPDDTPTSISLSDLGSIGAAHTDGGVIHIAAGVYRLDLPDAVLAAGSAGKRPLISIVHADCTLNYLEPVVSFTPTSNQAAIGSLNDLSPLAAESAAQVGATNALNNYDPPTHAELDTGLAALDTLIDSLLARLTAARAAKLDLIAPGDITIVAAGDGQTTRISQRAGDTWTIPLTSLGDLSDATKLIFAIKASQSDADADALLTLDLDGLQRVNGAAYGTAAHGEIDIDDDAAGDITITVAAVAAELFGKRKAVWAIKRVTSAGAVQTLRSGTFETTESIIDATS